MRKGILAVFILILTACKSHAFCFQEAGAMYNVSAELLYAIARVESNFNPLAINKNKNGTFDYGVMQINSSWYKIIGHKTWVALSDPCLNVKVGAWILSDCIKKHGSTWEAVGCYNANNKEKRKKYAWKIYQVLQRQGDAQKIRINYSIK